jgi:hypothetical protein
VKRIEHIGIVVFAILFAGMTPFAVINVAVYRKSEKGSLSSRRFQNKVFLFMKYKV